MGDDEFEPVAHLGAAVGEDTVFVAAEAELDLGPVAEFRAVAAVGREGLESAVDDGHFGFGPGDDGGDDEQGLLEVVELFGALRADAAVVDVHEHKAARLEFGDAFDGGVDVPGAGGAAAEPVAGNAVALDQRAGFDGFPHGLLGGGDAFFEGARVGGRAGIGLEALEADVLEARDVAGERKRGFAAEDAGAAADPEVESEIDAKAGGACGGVPIIGVLSVVNDEDGVGAAFGERNPLGDFVAADDSGGDEQSAGAAVGEGNRFREFGGAGADGAGLFAKFRDFGGFVGFGVGAETEPGLLQMSGHFGEIGFEFVEFDNEGRGGQVLAAFGHGGQGGGGDAGGEEEHAPGGHDS